MAKFLKGEGLSHLWDRIKTIVDGKMKTDGSNADQSISMPETDELSVISSMIDDSWVNSEVGFSLSDDLKYDTANVNITRQSSYTGAATIAVTPKAIDTTYHSAIKGDILTRHFGFRLPKKIGATAWQVGTRYIGKVIGGFIKEDFDNITCLGYRIDPKETELLVSSNDIYSKLPYKFYQGSAVVLDGEIHILGGSSNGTKHYKYSNGEWVEVSTLPYNFYQGSAVVLNGEIHILGGNSNNTKHYKWNGSTWISISTLPYEFYQGSAVVLNNEIHILGGYGSKSNTKHCKFSNGEWIPASPILPYKFYKGSAVVLDGEIHILGGSGNSTAHYKFSNDEWTSVSTLPYDFINGSAVVLNGEIHILSGNGAYTNHYKWNGSIWILDPELLYNFYQGSAVVLNGEIHILGGYGAVVSILYGNIKDDKLVSKLPYKFSEGSAVVLNGEIHILGGNSIAGSTSHYKLNGSTWISVSTLPYEFYQGSAVVLNGEIHILGGSGNSTAHYKFSNEEWVSVSTLPYDFYGGSAVVLNGEIHILGSAVYSYRAKHYKYSNGEWVEVSTLLPYDFYYGKAVVLNGEIHILGGYGSTGYTSHYKWNGSTWTPVSTLPYNFYYGEAVVLNGEIHILGGNTDYTAHYKWNGSTWTSVSILHYDFYYGSAVVLNESSVIKQRIGIKSTDISFIDNINNQILESYLENSSRTLTDIENVYKLEDVKLGDLSWDFYSSASGTPDVPNPVMPSSGIRNDRENYRVERVNDFYETDNSGEADILCTRYDPQDDTSPWIYFIEFPFAFFSKIAPAANANMYGGNYLWVSLFGHDPSIEDGTDIMYRPPGFGKEFTVYVKSHLKNPTTKKTTLLTEMTNGRKLIGAKADQPDNAIIIGDNNIAKSNGQIIIGQYADPKEDDAFVVGNGSGPDFLSNLFSVDTRGNFRTKGGMIWAQGELQGVLLANSPYWFDLEDGAGYIIFLNAKVNNGTYRGCHVYFMWAPWDHRDAGAQTTAGGAGRGTWIALGSNGTVGYSLGFYGKSYIHTDPGTGTTYTRYHTVVGIGSCATNIWCRFSIIKVMGSVEDFPK